MSLSKDILSGAVVEKTIRVKTKSGKWRKKKVWRPADKTQSPFADNDDMGGESGRYDDHMRETGDHPGD